MLRFWGGSTRGNEKICAVFVGVGGRGFFILCSRRAARIPPQSPVTLPNHRALRLHNSIGNRDGKGAGESQRFMAFEVADYAGGTRATRTHSGVRVLHCAPARHKFLFPVRKVSDWHACALTLDVSGPQRRAAVRRMAEALPAVAGPFDRSVKRVCCQPILGALEWHWLSSVRATLNDCQNWLGSSGIPTKQCLSARRSSGTCLLYRWLANTDGSYRRSAASAWRRAQAARRLQTTKPGHHRRSLPRLQTRESNHRPKPINIQTINIQEQ